MPLKLREELAQKAYITYLDDLQLSDDLQSGAIKGCAVITCADMGIQLPYVCSAPEANMLIFQNLGHSVLQSGVVDFLEGAEIDNIIVYGHSDCEFTRFLARPDERNEEGSELVSRHFQLESAFMIREYGESQEIDTESWLRANEWRVLNELRQLLAHPKILHRADGGQLSLHGWIHSEEQNNLKVFDPARKRFVSNMEELERGRC